MAAREAFHAYLAATEEIGLPLEPLDVLALTALRALNRGARKHPLCSAS